MRLLIVIIVSASLMIWNAQHSSESTRFRSYFSLLFTPLIDLTNAPFAFFESMSKQFQSQKDLLKENKILQAKVLILNGELQKLKALQFENRELRYLLQSNTQLHHLHFVEADVMAVQADPFHQTITLDKGSHDNVFVGQAVLDAHGVMGEVINVSLYNSKVLLVTDPKSGIPIQDSRTGLRGILVGGGSSSVLYWKDALSTVDVTVGDELVTSGLGGHYPAGYPVGKVISLAKQAADDTFLLITVMPSAKINSSEQVLLVWPDKKT